MTKIATLKAQAQNLKAAMSSMGIALSLAQAQEAVAQQYGLGNWDTAVGVLKKPSVAPRAPRLADMEYVPSDIWVEGTGPRSMKCTVESYEWDALCFHHDEAAMRAFVEADPMMYEDGMDSIAIYLFGDGLDYKFTFNQLVGMEYVGLGGGNWRMKDGTYLRFCCDDLWNPEKDAALKSKENVELVVPKTVKSIKGCQLVQLTSHDGSAYDHFVIVPPHLDAQKIADQLKEEIQRLKTLDRENQDNPAYEEYTDVTLEVFAASLGCLPVRNPVKVTENWDV